MQALGFFCGKIGKVGWELSVVMVGSGLEQDSGGRNVKGCGFGKVGAGGEPVRAGAQSGGGGGQASGTEEKKGLANAESGGRME